MRKNNKGLTLPETLIAAVILVMAFVGILGAFVRCLELMEMARNTSNATLSAKSKMEQILNTPVFADLDDYNAISFTPAGFNGKGISYVTDVNVRFKTIVVAVCWRQKNGRVIGEDKNLNGTLDAGEDLDGDGKIGSIVQLTSNVFNEP